MASDPKEIWLEPACCADPHNGRLWAEDNPFPECDDGVQPTRYVRADLAALSAPPAPPPGDLVERVEWRGQEIPFDCPYPSIGRTGAPYGYNIDPGAGSAMDRLQRDWPSKLQVLDLRERDGRVTPLYPLRTTPADPRPDPRDEALLAVVQAVRDYLPLDGISADECIGRVIGAVDNPGINPIIKEIEKMPVREIAAQYEHTCDGCGAKEIKASKSRPAYWTGLSIEADAHDYQGAACADASVKRLLCRQCTTVVHAAVNASIAESQALAKINAVMAGGEG